MHGNPKRPRRRAIERAALCKEGIRLGARVVPLLAGSVHYFRLESHDWRPALEGVRSLGLRLVDVYVPWSVHERAPGEYDFGEHDTKLDVVGFLRIAAELGLYAIVRPGPHVNAELTQFGIPERVLWSPDCQARSAGGKPVVLPVPPLAFPVPSYASEAFHTEVLQWFSAVGSELAALCWPKGPIVMLQVDNEGAMYFRDGVYDQDYHPDAIARYRRFLQHKYRSVALLREAHADEAATFTAIEPPRRMTADNADELTPHLDWAEFQEVLLANAFERMREALTTSSLGNLPTSHNLPLSEGLTPLDPERVGRAVDLIGLDYYHGATAPQRSEIARRTSDLSVRSELRAHPAFACELGAGFPPFFPPLSDEDNAFTAMTALAYGLRGFNVYMAVERDRWIGAPIDRHGKRRPSAAFWERLVGAIERTRFYRLTRKTPVYVVVPRSLRRLARVLHAFGPLSPALFHVLGGGAEEACFEEDFGMGSAVVIEAMRFLRRLERALDRRGVPFAVLNGDLLGHALEEGSWTVLVSCGALGTDLMALLDDALERGCAVALGPRWPERDAAMRPLVVKTRQQLARLQARTELLIPGDEALLDQAVDRAIRTLALPVVTAEPAEVLVTLHHDRASVLRVAFVINPTETELIARVPGIGGEVVDALDGQVIRAESGVLSLSVPRRSVRMLEILEPALAQ
jgi:beta-galactosidase